MLHGKVVHTEWLLLLCCVPARGVLRLQVHSMVHSCQLTVLKCDLAATWNREIVDGKSGNLLLGWMPAAWVSAA